MSTGTVAAQRLHHPWDGSPESSLLAKLRPAIHFLLCYRAHAENHGHDAADLDELMEVWKGAMSLARYGTESADFDLGHRLLGECLLIMQCFGRASADAQVLVDLVVELGKVYGTLDDLRKGRDVDSMRIKFVYDQLNQLSRSIDY